MILKKVLKLLLLLNMFSKTNESFRLHNTDDLYRDDIEECLYSNEINVTKNEWILIRYCIGGDDSKRKSECYGNITSTFNELKLKNISSQKLLQWNTPIDTINNYEKYLSENDLSMKNDLFCNCSG